LQRLAVVAGVFEGFGGEGIPVLEKIDAQPALQTQGRAAALGFGIMRFNPKTAVASEASPLG